MCKSEILGCLRWGSPPTSFFFKLVASEKLANNELFRTLCVRIFAILDAYRPNFLDAGRSLFCNFGRPVSEKVRTWVCENLVGYFKSDRRRLYIIKRSCYVYIHLRSRFAQQIYFYVRLINDKFEALVGIILSHSNSFFGQYKQWSGLIVTQSLIL